MKKLFALVLTLALVFAIAAPAMAATWGATPADTGSPFTVKVTQYIVKTSATGATYDDLYPANQGVVGGTSVKFNAVITIPSQAKLDTYYNDPADVGTLGAYVDLTNITLTGATGTSKVGTADATTLANMAAILDADNAFLAALITPNATSTTVLNVTFIGTVDKTANAKADVVIGYDALTAVPAGGLTRTVNGVAYTINTTGVTWGTSSALTFEANANGTVGDWYITDGTTDYTVIPGPLFYAAGVKVTAPATLVADYNNLVALLGFKVGDTGIYFTPANILANYSPTLAVKGTAAYTAYTANLTVTDGTSVPNTGDNMSVIGFVMVGLALLATAAVVVKKVRA